MINKLYSLLDKVAATIPNYDQVDTAISASDVGWHIEHIFLTVNKITEAVANSIPDNYKWKFNFIRIVVLTTGKIPRGRAQSPKSVLPSTNINSFHLNEHLSSVKKQIQLLATIPKDHYFEHPFFGMLRLKQTFRFLEIHTSHHLSIIQDIISKQTNIHS